MTSTGWFVLTAILIFGPIGYMIVAEYGFKTLLKCTICSLWTLLIFACLYKASTTKEKENELPDTGYYEYPNEDVQ